MTREEQINWLAYDCDRTYKMYPEDHQRTGMLWVSDTHYNALPTGNTFYSGWVIFIHVTKYKLEAFMLEHLPDGELKTYRLDDEEVEFLYNLYQGDEANV